METDDEQEPGIELAQTDEKSEIPKGADAFAVVMVGSEMGFFSFDCFFYKLQFLIFTSYFLGFVCGEHFPWK